MSNVIYVMLIALNVISIAGVFAVVSVYLSDVMVAARIHNETSKVDRYSLCFSAVAMFWFAFCVVHGVASAPVHFILFLLVLLLFHRQPAGSDFSGKPTHHAWRMRFTLLELFVGSVLIGLLLYWHFHGPQMIQSLSSHI